MPCGIAHFTRVMFVSVEKITGNASLKTFFFCTRFPDPYLSRKVSVADSCSNHEQFAHRSKCLYGVRVVVMLKKFIPHPCKCPIPHFNTNKLFWPSLDVLGVGLCWLLAGNIHIRCTLLNSHSRQSVAEQSERSPCEWMVKLRHSWANGSWMG